MNNALTPQQTLSIIFIELSSFLGVAISVCPTPPATATCTYDEYIIPTFHHQ